MKKLVLILILSLSSFAMDYMKEGAKKLMPLKKGLMKELKSAMKSGGATKAISSCNIKGPQISEGISSQKVSVGRSSLKYRNPKNAPEKWMVGILKKYESSKSKRPQIVKLDNGVGYVEPIYLKGLCLNCHGTKLNNKVAERISALYPEDRATGYKPNDFRGIFWVKFKKDR